MPRDPPHRDSDPPNRRNRRERSHHQHDRDPEYERRRRRGHRATDSTGELLPRHDKHTESTSESASPTKPRPHRMRGTESNSASSSNPLSMGSLAKLDALNEKLGWKDFDEGHLRDVRERERGLERERVREEQRKARRREREIERDRRRRRVYESEPEDYGGTHEYSERAERYRGVEVVEEKRRRYTDSEREEKRRRYTRSERGERRRRRKSQGEEKERRRKRRVVSGPLLEEGGKEELYEYMAEKRGGAGSIDYDEEKFRRKRKKRILIIVGVISLILAIVIPVAILVSKKNSGPVQSDSSAKTSKPSNNNLNSISESEVPASAKGTILDPFAWYDTTDFNVTYTDVLVGGLPIMGLNSTWDDSVQANPNVPALKDPFPYGTMPIRGMNIGGWLSIEPFITPSLFSRFSTHDGVIDEYTLSSKLGSTRIVQTLEEHYSSFVNRQTFEEIRAAGMDHVRIPFSYWAVTTYEGDPYVAKISWRYLLRGIEWARQSGLRVNLDLHGLPGSQNGWNHSGRQGHVGWLNGTDGALNAQRSLDIHNQLSTFFAQPRYKNVVTMYGLVNEPRMVSIDTETVLDWTNQAISLVRKNNITGIIVFGDGFMGLDNWQGKLQSEANLVLDVHQYVIFNVDQIALSHTDKLNFACKGWTAQTLRSSNKATGFGPTMCGEWSQADTDCAQYLNNVGVGSRWEGTLNTGNASTSVLDPTCPTHNSPTCDCAGANADPATYSAAYKQWLLQFAVAQMDSFEQGWGWFYWTWQTETATQWSYKAGLKAGILPQKAYERSWNCGMSIPDFAGMGLAENY